MWVKENLQCIFIAFLTCNFERYICFQTLIAANALLSERRENSIYFMDGEMQYVYLMQIIFLLSINVTKIQKVKTFVYFTGNFIK